MKIRANRVVLQNFKLTCSKRELGLIRQILKWRKEDMERDYTGLNAVEYNELLDLISIMNNALEEEK